MESASNNTDGGPKTSTKLLQSLRATPADQAAWAEFVASYAKMIYGWCRRWKVQDADAADITQTVLLRVSRKIGAFSYDQTRSFRGWLKTLTYHAWQDHVQRRRPSVISRNGTAEWMESVPA